MEFYPVDRSGHAFQASVSPRELLAMCRRAFGPTTEVLSAVELSGGLYNNTYRVDIGHRRPVILRVAPSPSKQSRLERELMRNEYASIPFFAPLAGMMPNILFADWTRDIAGRDYMWQTLLDGVPAREGLNAYARSRWSAFFEQLGRIARTIHNIRGPEFGRIAGPHHATWSGAVLTLLEDTVRDLEDADLPATDVHGVLAIAARHAAILDEVTEPRLLHGDLWVPNLLLTPGAPEPTIAGFLDHDRALFGDPAADWVIFMAERRPGTERDAFWNTYGPLSGAPTARWRRLVYRAMHLAALRLERHRLGREANPEDDEALQDALQLLAAFP
jgi:aminoglycoside phosphotransferase (APT) family kinase protein